jgi:hypothetical protein
MVRPIRNIDVFLPLDYNDGTPIPEATFTALQRELLNRFGGVTSTQRQFPLQGIWQTGAEVYYDRVVVFSVIDFRDETELECLRYLQRLKGRLKKKFDQLEILITVAELLAV